MSAAAAAAMAVPRPIQAPIPEYVGEWVAISTHYLRKVEDLLDAAARSVMKHIFLSTVGSVPAPGKRTRPEWCMATAKEIAQSTGYHQNAIERALIVLREAGVLEASGTKRDRRYRVQYATIAQAEPEEIEARIKTAKSTLRQEAKCREQAQPEQPASSEPLVLMAGESEPRPLSEVCRSAQCPLLRDKNASVDSARLTRIEPAITTLQCGNDSLSVRLSETVWTRIQTVLKSKLHPASYSNWIERSEQLSFEQGKLTVRIVEFAEPHVREYLEPLDLAQYGVTSIAFETISQPEPPEQSPQTEFAARVERELSHYFEPGFTLEIANTLQGLMHLPEEYFWKVVRQKKQSRKFQSRQNAWEFLYGIVYHDAWHQYATDLSANNVRLRSTLNKMSPGETARSSPIGELRPR